MIIIIGFYSQLFIRLPFLALFLAISFRFRVSLYRRLNDILKQITCFFRCFFSFLRHTQIYKKSFTSILKTSAILFKVIIRTFICPSSINHKCDASVLHSLLNLSKEILFAFLADFIFAPPPPPPDDEDDLFTLPIPLDTKRKAYIKYPLSDLKKKDIKVIVRALSFIASSITEENEEDFEIKIVPIKKE